jgi:hypothetical protein
MSDAVVSDAAGVLMLCEMLGEDTVAGAVAALVALREHLAEVAAALGCADGGDVLKAARVCAVDMGTNGGCRCLCDPKGDRRVRVRAGIRWLAERAARSKGGHGDMPPAVGAVLTPADFGSGEGCDGGVLRLAALLAEAPIGATVRDCSLCEHVKTDSGWGRLDHRRDETDYDLALYFAPLTVIEWPAYGPARPAS